MNSVIKGLVITEKAIAPVGKQLYVIWVHEGATKIDIKLAFESLYHVSVESVNVVTTKPKYAFRKKGIAEKRQAAKKAYVTLKKGEKQLDIFTSAK